MKFLPFGVVRFFVALNFATLSIFFLLKDALSRNEKFAVLACISFVYIYFAPDLIHLILRFGRYRFFRRLLGVKANGHIPSDVYLIESEIANGNVVFKHRGLSIIKYSPFTGEFSNKVYRYDGRGIEYITETTMSFYDSTSGMLMSQYRQFKSGKERTTGSVNGQFSYDQQHQKNVYFGLTYSKNKIMAIQKGIAISARIINEYKRDFGLRGWHRELLHDINTRRLSIT